MPCPILFFWIKCLNQSITESISQSCKQEVLNFPSISVVLGSLQEPNEDPSNTECTSVSSALRRERHHTSANWCASLQCFTAGSIQAWAHLLVALCLTSWFASNEKGMAIHDTGYPYWDQVSFKQHKLKTYITPGTGDPTYSLDPHTIVRSHETGVHYGQHGRAGCETSTAFQSFLNGPWVLCT